MLTSPRQRSFMVSGVVHAGLVGLLLLMASRAPLPTEAPIRLRLVEPPTPRVEPAPRMPAPAPGAGRVPEGSRPRGAEPPPQTARPRPPERPAAPERVVPRGIPAPDVPRVAPVPVPPPAPPPAAVRPAPAPTAPSAPLGGPPVELPRETARAASRESPPPRPERGGLTLGGPSEGASLPPPTAPDSGPSSRGRSIRDQLAGLGTGLREDDAPGKHTVHLDSREPRFQDYLSRLKGRIYQTWNYPEEAWGNGISGELLLVFTLNKAGTLTDVRLLQSSGFPILDQEALRAVKAAAPYDPFPPHLGEDPWNIAASFRYFMPYRFRRN